MSDTSDQRSFYGPSDDATPVPSTLGPWTAYTLSSCAFALTAYSMGAQWLASPWLGLPVGVWGVASGFAVLAAVRNNAQTGANASSLRLPFFSGATASASDFFGRLRRAGGDDSAKAAPSTPSAPRQTASERRSGAVVIRIGLDLPNDERELILEAAARFGPFEGIRFEWVTLNDENANAGANAGRSPEPRGRRWSDRLRPCDATLRRTGGGGGGAGHGRAKSSLEITTLQHTQSSAWIDWGKPEEFSYAGVFPTRLDPARVSLGGARIDGDSAPALARLAAAAAAFRRTAAFGSSGGVGLNASPAERAADDLLLETFRWAVSASPNANTATPIQRVAARVGSAWVVGRGLAVAPAERVRLVGAAASMLNREPQLVLQSLASVVAAAAAGGNGGSNAAEFESSSADNAMVEAVERLLELDERATVDPFPFVMSELEHGNADALTLGRIAAGAAMLWSGARGSSMKFLREDLLSDVEHTGWLRQRPPLRALLTRLVRGADRARGEWDQKQSSRRAA